MQLDHLVIRRRIVVVVELLAGRNRVINAEEAGRDRDDHGGHGQRIEKGRQKRGRKRKQQRQQHLGAHTQQDFRKRE